jgi:hypothetical protein
MKQLSLQLALTHAGNFMAATLSPSRYLWPWFLSSIVFCAFLFSAQGRSLAMTAANAPLVSNSNGWVIGALAIFLFHSVLACWFASVASIQIRISSRSSSGRFMSLDGWRFFCHAAWLLSLSVGPLFAYALATMSTIVMGFACVTVLVVSLIIGIAANKNLFFTNLIKRGFNFSKSHRFTLALVAAIFAVIPLYIGATIVSKTPTVLAEMGPLLVALIGLTSFASLVGVILVVIPICLNQSWIGWIFGIILIGLSFISPLSLDLDNPLLREERKAATVDAKEWQKECADQAPDIEEEIRRRVVYKKKDDDEKTILVSSEGGGIRAAYWTAVGLANLDLVSNGRFSQNVAVLSGVSGGSLGIATWIASHELKEKSLNDRVEVVSTFLSSDFLSPLIGGLLFLDAPRAIFRGAWPEARRDQVFERALYDRWFQLTTSNFFARPLRRLCLHGFDRAPQIIFNASDASTGYPVRLSNSNFNKKAPFAGSIYKNSLDQSTLRWATVAQAVSISARFPYLSPGANVGIALEQVSLPLLDFAFTDFASQNRFEPVRKPASQAYLEKKNRSPLDDFVGNVLAGAEEYQAELKSKGPELDRLSEVSANPKGWARLGVLVDGGYFDNSGAAPIHEAIAKFRLMKEPRSFKTFHFSNDPAEVCIPLPKDLKNSAAADFLVASKAKVSCDFEFSYIEDSLAKRPFQFFTTPIEAIFSVRGIHAVQTVEPLEVKLSSFISGSNTISAATEMNSYRASEKLFMQSYEEIPGWNLDAGEITRRSAQHRALIEKTWRQKKISRDAELTDLNYWLADALRMHSIWNCDILLLDRRPPLGWMLNPIDIEILKCLSARAAVRQEFENLRPPWDDLKFSEDYRK